jgi:hypothetical protein
LIRLSSYLTKDNSCHKISTDTFNSDLSQKWKW